MDRSLDVRTPESIAFSYELAGIGSRALAVTIDFCIQLAILALLVWGIVLLAGGAAHSSHPAHLPPAPDRLAMNIIAGIAIFIVFAIFFGYFMLFEALWNGQTPGKKILGIRVVRDGGYPIDFSAALVRNLVRVGEWALGGYALSALCALLSPENKRVGDYAAGTIVVRDHAMDAPVALLDDLREEPSYAATAYLSGEERAIVRRFLERRDTLVLEARERLAHQLAERVRARVPAELARLDDESLLERL